MVPYLKSRLGCAGKSGISLFELLCLALQKDGLQKPDGFSCQQWAVQNREHIIEQAGAVIKALPFGGYKSVKIDLKAKSKRQKRAKAVEALEAKLATGNNWTSPASKQRSSRIDPNSPEFLESYEWRSLRMEVLAKYGPVCMCCGATREDGEKMHVDHIKPRRKRPDLALIFDNLQVLCGTCNHGKGNWDETDWRPIESHQKEFDDSASYHLRLIAKT